jgi:hypothetical protein
MNAKIAVSMIAILTVALADQPTQQTHEFALALKTIKERVRAGTAPEFYLTLTNISGHPCRVLNIAKRADLQDAYYELIVTKNGKRVQVPIAISDPGSISDRDWVELAPRATKTFTLRSFAQLYDQLRPGTYQAYVRFWRDPNQSHKTAYNSELATFTVSE